MKERTKLFLILLVFAACYYIPWDNPIIQQSGLEAFMMLQEYARKHVLTCLIPAFFIAGAIAVFVSQASVLKYFGATAKKILSYSVASVSGTVLAVCSCTVLPLFAGIYTRGAGIGPATAFLYSGPAINVLAIVLTARILGWQLGLARAIGAVLFAIITGLLMSFIFRKDDAARTVGQIYLPDEEEKGRSLMQEALFMLTMVLVLIFAAFARPATGSTGVWPAIFAAKWYITAGLLVVLVLMLKNWFVKEERTNWVQSTWGFMKQIFPLLGAGVLVAGWRSGSRFHAGETRAFGPDSRTLYPKPGGRQFPVGQSICFCLRRPYVLCHPYRGAYTSGSYRCRHGQGTGLVPSAGGSGPFASQYVSDWRRYGCKEDCYLLWHHCNFIDRCGNVLRLARGLMIHR
jgi:uncharacterized membrane protein YraQ (UPF0718 family)